MNRQNLRYTVALIALIGTVAWLLYLVAALPPIDTDPAGLRGHATFVGNRATDCAYVIEPVRRGGYRLITVPSPIALEESARACAPSAAPFKVEDFCGRRYKLHVVEGHAALGDGAVRVVRLAPFDNDCGESWQEALQAVP